MGSNELCVIVNPVALAIWHFCRGRATNYGNFHSDAPFREPCRTIANLAKRVRPCVRVLR
jgi:hypothetical protein